MTSLASSPFAIAVTGPPGLPAWADYKAIPPGTRKNISLNYVRDVDSCPSRNCVWTKVGSLEGVFSAWSGGALATDYSEHGALVCWGGGHGNNSDNSIYLFNLTTRRWERLGRASPYNEKTPQNDWIHLEYPDGQPIPVHTYAGVQYLPASLGGGPKGSFIKLPCGGPQNQSHRFDLAEQKWSRWGGTIDPRLAGLGSNYGMSFFDSKRGGFWYSGWFAASNCLFYDRDGNATIYKVGSNWANGVPAHSPELDVAVMIGWIGADNPTPHLYLMFPAQASTKVQGGWHQAKWAGDYPLDGPTSIDWCTPLHAFVGYSSGRPRSSLRKLAAQSYSDIFVLTPPTDLRNGTWTIRRQTIAGDAPVCSPVGNGGYGRFRWVDKLRAFIWAEGKDNPVQLIRPVGA